MDGKVHVVQADRTLYADRATYDTVTGHGSADGNVRMEFPGVMPAIATPKPITIKKKIP
jgi:lipopolysaccharide assembly outer membrane protein LptD (OstA)